MPPRVEETYLHDSLGHIHIEPFELYIDGTMLDDGIATVMQSAIELRPHKTFTTNEQFTKEETSKEVIEEWKTLIE